MDAKHDFSKAIESINKTFPPTKKSEYDLRHEFIWKHMPEHLIHGFGDHNEIMSNMNRLGVLFKQYRNQTDKCEKFSRCACMDGHEIICDQCGKDMKPSEVERDDRFCSEDCETAYYQDNGQFGVGA